MGVNRISTAELDWDGLSVKIVEVMLAISFSQTMESGTVNQKLNAIHILYRDSPLLEVPLVEDYDELVKFNHLEDIIMAFRARVRREKKELTKEMFRALPETSTADYRRVSDKLDRNYPLEQQAALLKSGGPWHHWCGEKFTMDPGDSPICPKCYPQAHAEARAVSSGVRSIQEAVDAEMLTVVDQWIDKHDNKAALDGITSQIVTQIRDESRWNSTCQCGAPAYIGMHVVECSVNCSGSK